MKINVNKNDVDLVSKYFYEHKDWSIQEMYDFIKLKKLKQRSKVEHLVFTYLFMNRKKLGLKC